MNITQLHAEAIHSEHGSIYHHYSNTKEITVYITKGDGEEISYTPLFVYMGFRYVQLTNYPGVPDFKTLTAHFVHTANEMTGNIDFSDPNLTAVQHITRAASLSNTQSIPTDCPQRERRGCHRSARRGECACLRRDHANWLSHPLRTNVAAH